MRIMNSSHSSSVQKPITRSAPAFKRGVLKGGALVRRWVPRRLPDPNPLIRLGKQAAAKPTSRGGSLTRGRLCDISVIARVPAAD